MHLISTPGRYCTRHQLRVTWYIQVVQSNTTNNTTRAFLITAFLLQSGRSFHLALDLYPLMMGAYQDLAKVPNYRCLKNRKKRGVHIKFSYLELIFYCVVVSLVKHRAHHNNIVAGHEKHTRSLTHSLTRTLCPNASPAARNIERCFYVFAGCYSKLPLWPLYRTVCVLVGVAGALNWIPVIWLFIVHYYLKCVTSSTYLLSGLKRRVVVLIKIIRFCGRSISHKSSKIMGVWLMTLATIWMAKEDSGKRKIVTC